MLLGPLAVQLLLKLFQLLASFVGLLLLPPPVGATALLVGTSGHVSLALLQSRGE
jgi:hypothetical protein